MKYLLKDSSTQTIAEEWANTITHGLGMMLSIAALVWMTVSATKLGTTAVTSSIIFGASLVLLYLTSSLYHAVWHPKVKQILQMFDHMMIYLLIAGSYTPFMLVGLGGGWGWSIFGVVWGLALVGIVFKLFFTGRMEVLSVALYLTMGWISIIAIKPIYHALPWGGLLWLILGGLAYTVGIIFYIFDRIRYAHTIWHVFVLAGSLCHVCAVLFYVLHKHH